MPTCLTIPCISAQNSIISPLNIFEKSDRSIFKQRNQYFYT
ncbi:hypothetical protein GXM_00894 [Nostoc sphaeroides CCNUC1]|uniref:Uncharacterized protein n=1 Tax=Nostoc sphaeroides CCNUC1 TaxID=2653204 RepID=A0A5P8VSW9_9NOSO|nr:hypothetical protein GXM_00894 [Nostoc sphaeroides CCNUC1]